MNQQWQHQPMQPWQPGQQLQIGNGPPGKGKGQQLKLSCGAVGVNTFKLSGEHVKSYPYKELADWAQGSHAGKEVVTLFKRDRNMAGTEFVCDGGDAARGRNLGGRVAGRRHAILERERRLHQDRVAAERAPVERKGGLDALRVGTTSQRRSKI